jgi:hypothetical protein
VPAVTLYEYVVPSVFHHHRSQQQHVVADEEELLAHLRIRSRGRPSTFVDLVAVNGNILSLGLAGERACAMFTGESMMPQYLWASREAAEGEAGVEFDEGGTPTVVPPAHILPLDQVLRIASLFFQSGNISRAQRWDPE